MSTKSRAKLSPDEVATEAEIEAAISELSDADLLRLQRSAESRWIGMGRHGRDCLPSDLLQEAICRTLAGRRRWQPARCGFYQHLLGAVRSVASNWPRKREQASGEPQDVEAAGLSDHPMLPTLNQTGSERVVAAKQEVGAIIAAFEDDEQVLFVIEGLSDEMKGPEIQEMLNITQTEYETLMKRLRRKVRRLFDGGHDA